MCVFVSLLPRTIRGFGSRATCRLWDAPWAGKPPGCPVSCATPPPIFDAKTATPVTSEKSCTVTTRAGSPSSTTFEPWECTFSQVCRRRGGPLSYQLRTTGRVDPGRSDARERQIAPNHSAVDARYAPSRAVHHHAVAKPISGMMRTSQPEPQLPLHGAVQEPRRHQVRESPGQSLAGRQSSLLAGVSTGHPSTV